MEHSLEPGDRHQLTYVLRIWREHGAAPWRAALRSAESGDLLGFADLDELLLFLQRELGPPRGPGRPERQEDGTA
jgi:hypothetical protein